MNFKVSLIALIMITFISAIEKSPKIIVTYFMTTYHCHSCHYLENMTQQTLLTEFPKEMKDSTIIFKTTNIDEPINEHYIDGFGLEFKSVVVTKLEKDSIIEWNRLDSLWDYIEKDQEFSGIIKRSVKDYLAK